MFSADFMELHRLGIFQCYKGELLLSDFFDLLRVKEDSLSPIYDMRRYDTFLATDEGIWFSTDTPDGSGGLADRVDVFGDGNVLERVPFHVTDQSYISNDKIISAGFKGLYVHDRKVGKTTRLDGEFHTGVAVCEGAIVCREYGVGVRCVGTDLAEQWSVKLSVAVRTKIVRGPQLAGGLAVVNLGTRDSRGQGEFLLRAYEIISGNPAWEVSLPASPYCSSVIGDKVYISVDDRFLVLDALTGETLVDKKHQFSSRMFHFISPVPEGLLAGSEPDGVLHVYESQGSQLKQSIRLPERFSVPCWERPVICSGAVYLGMLLREMTERETCSGLLALRPAEGKYSELTVGEPRRPVITIEVREHGGKGTSHHLSIRDGQLDTVVRYAKIELKRLARNISSGGQGADWAASHDGTITFETRWQPGWDSDWRERLTETGEKIEWYCEKSRLSAPSGENPLRIIPVFQDEGG